MNRLAVFDCDGTLVDSQATICRAMEEAFAGARIEPPGRTAIRRIVGLSLVPAIAELLPEAGSEFHVRLADDYKAAFFRLRAAGQAEEPLFDGIAETIAVLDAGGWQLGVATGKSDRGLNHVLERHALKHHFVTLQTADRHPSKPHPAMLAAAIAEAGACPETTAMIGDTSFDMAMARAAGAHGVGVAWGYHPPMELTAAGACVVAEHAQSLPVHLEAL